MKLIIEMEKGYIKSHGGNALSLEALPDGWYDVEIKKYKNKRSLQQNRYYWGVVILFIQSFFNSFKRTVPMTPSQAHAQFKDMAGLYEDVQIYNRENQILEERRVYRSFSNAGDLTTVDFMKACDIVREAIVTISGGEYILPEPGEDLRSPGTSPEGIGNNK